MNASYVGDCPLFIRAQAAELDDLDPYYVQCAGESANGTMRSLFAQQHTMLMGDLRRAVYFTLHTTAGLP